MLTLLTNYATLVHPHTHAPAQVWSTKGVDGVHRFLARVYRLCSDGVSDDEPSRDQLRLLHQTIKRVWAHACMLMRRGGEGGQMLPADATRCRSRSCC